MNRWSVTWRIRIVRRRPFFVFKQLFPHPKRFWRTSLFHIMALWYSTFASVSNNCQGSLKNTIQENSPRRPKTVFRVRVSFYWCENMIHLFSVTDKAGILSDNFCVTRSRFVFFFFDAKGQNHLFYFLLIKIFSLTWPKYWRKNRAPQAWLSLKLIRSISRFHRHHVQSLRFLWM